MLNGALRNNILVVILIFALSFCGCQTQLMPTPNLYIVSAENPLADVKPGLRSNKVNVLYVTDRKVKDRVDGVLEGYELLVAVVAHHSLVGKVV